MSRRWLIPLFVAVLLFITVAILPIAMAQPLTLTDVTFTGRLTYIQFLIGGATGTVQVYEVISGPPLDPEVTIWTISVPECEGKEWDPSLQVGDEVEVHGIYESSSSVKVCGAGYYVRKTAIATPTPTPTATTSPDCSITIDFDSGKTCFLPGETIVMKVEFRHSGILADPDPLSYQMLLHLPDGSVSNITERFFKVDTGVYESSGTIGGTGARTLEVTGTINGCWAEERKGYIVKTDCVWQSWCFDVAYPIHWDGYGDMETGCTYYDRYYDVHQASATCDDDYVYFLWEIDGAVGQPPDSNFAFWGYVDADDNASTGGLLGAEYLVHFAMYETLVVPSWTGLFDATASGWPPPQLYSLTEDDYCFLGSYLEVRVPKSYIRSYGTDLKVFMGVDVNFFGLACMDEVDPFYISSQCALCLDRDGDSYTDVVCGGTDCNDDDPAINPGATEICDAIDWDCDGDPRPDNDDDGYFDENCDGDDCDDSDASVYPGALEVCNGQDDDCNDLVDDNCVTATPTATVTATSTSTPTATPTSTNTPTPTDTPTPTPTATATNTPTPTNTPTNTPTPTPTRGVTSGILGLSSPHVLSDDYLYIFATIKDNFGQRYPGRSDVEVHIDSTTVTLDDNGPGANLGDLRSFDGEYGAWYQVTGSGTFTPTLYVGNTLVDSGSRSVTVLANKNPDLLVLTDIAALYQEFLDTGTAQDEDNDGDGIVDFYELLNRLYQYALPHKGIVYDLRKEVSGYSSLSYTTAADREDMGEKIDQFIHDVCEETKQSSWGGLSTSYPLDYVAIVGDDQVVPFYRKADPKSKESGYLSTAYPNPLNPSLADTRQDKILTDVPYMTRGTSIPTHGLFGGGPSPDMASGRVFAQHPHQLTSAIDKYERTVTIDDVVVFAENPVTWEKRSRTRGHWPVTWTEEWLESVDGDPNFPAVAKKEVIQVLDDEIAASKIDAHTGDPYRNGGTTDPWTPVTYTNGISSHDLTYILAHASHTGQNTAAAGSISQNTYLGLSAATEKKVVVNGGCHSGYSTSREGGDWGLYDNALVLGPLNRGIAYIASTTYGIYTGSNIEWPSLGYRGAFWTERMMKMYSQQLTQAATVGEAYRKAIVEYDNLLALFDATDEYTMYAQMLYGLPTQKLSHSVTRGGAIVRLISSEYLRRPHQAQLVDSALQVTVDVAEVYTATVGAERTLFTAFGADYFTEGGGPILPQLTLSCYLPAGSTVSDVRLDSAVTTTLAGSYQLLQSQPMLGEGPLIETDFTPTNPYPLEPFTWAVKEEAGGIRLVLRVIPLRWNPETDAVTLLDDLVFTMDYSAPVPPTTVQVVDSEVEQPAYAVGESIGVLVTLAATEAAQAGLEVRLTDPGGNLLHYHTETLDLPAGTSVASYAIPTQTFSAGTKYVEVLVAEPETGNLIRGDVHAVILMGLTLNAWLDRGLYTSNVVTAELTVQVRDEVGELVNGLSSRFTVMLDDQPVSTAFAQVDAGIYAATIPLAGLALGQHTLEVGCLDWQGGSVAETIPFVIVPGYGVYLPLIMR